MRNVVVVSGVLGLGTVLVFALAAVAATMFPNGTLINNSWNGGCFDCGGWGKPGIAVPMPMPVDGVPEKGFVDDRFVVLGVGEAEERAAADEAGDADPGGTNGDVLPQP